MDAIEAPRVKEKPIEPFSLEEVQRPERTAEGPEHKAMQLSLKLMLYCGIHPTEVTLLAPQRDIVGDELIIRPTTNQQDRRRAHRTLAQGRPVHQTTPRYPHHS